MKKQKKKVKIEPVPIGYRLLGALVTVIGIGMVAFTILIFVTTTKEVAITVFLAAISIVIMVPGFGLLLTKDKASAKKWLAMLLLGLWPIP